MKILRPSSVALWLGAALAAAPAWAAQPTTTVQVSYTVDSQAVPTFSSPAALGLLALFLVVLALSRFKRAPGRRFWSALLLAGLVSGLGLGAISDVRAGAGDSTVSLSQGNPASGTGLPGTWTITNDLRVAATLTDIQVRVTLGSGNWSGTAPQPCSIGLKLAPGASCTLIAGSAG